MVEIKKYFAGVNNGYIHQITIASGPVILSEGKVLLTKDPADPFWKFPGGTVRDNESFQETSIREAMEETSLEIELQGEPFIYTFHMTDEEEKEVKYFVLVHYSALVKGKDEIKVIEEGKEVRFFDFNNLPEELAPNVVATLRHFGIV